MITQPLMITSPDVASSTPVPGSTATGDKGFSEDFLSLLGKALPGQLTLADGKTVSLEAALNKTAAKGSATADEKTTLASLLNNLDTPEGLSALLSSVKKTGSDEKVAQVEAQQEQDHSLSTADMQALSALFAMLPQQMPATSAVALPAEGDKNVSVDLKSLLSGGDIKNAPGNDAPKNAPASDKTIALDATPAAKSVPANTAEPLPDAKTFTVSNAENGNRDAAANNTSTASPLLTPTVSSATVATPATTQIAVPVAPQISAQLGSQEWQQAFSQHITLFTRQGQQSAELRLLGQIQISMKLDDNQAQLQMVSAHSHVRAALEATLPNLRLALAESGIQLGQSSISSESFAGQQQQQSGQNPQQSPRSASTFPSMGDGETLAVPASVQRLASGNNAVDIFA